MSGVDAMDGGHGLAAGLTIQALSLSLGGCRLFRDLSLPSLPPGSLVALVGANGAGKSSLLRALAGLLPAQGRCRLDGRELAGLERAERRRLVSYLPQALPVGNALLAYEWLLGAARHACLPPGLAPEAAIEAVLEELGLLELALRPMAALSGGQRQMFAFAQMLVQGGRLLLLDEPTSALDLRWQQVLMGALRRRVASRGAIALVALHDINLALRHCPTLLLLHQGRVAAAGPGAEVLSRELLAAVYGVQGRVERCSRGLGMLVLDPV